MNLDRIGGLGENQASGASAKHIFHRNSQADHRG
jgi:hypothetical protein